MVVPLMKMAHNTGVASLAWMSDGQLLAVGCTQRNIQIYDLRIQGKYVYVVYVYV